MQCRVDAAEQSGEHSTGSDFEEPVDAPRCQIPHRFFPPNRIGNLLDQPLSRLGAGLNLARLPIVNERPIEIVKHRPVQFRRHALLGRFHQRAMEWRAHGERDRPPGASRFGQIHRAAHRTGVSGDHNLVRRIQIGRGDDFALSGVRENFLQASGRKPEDRGHRPLSRGDGFLHKPAAFPH